jgi:excisionase family DNA binding protein
MRRLWSGPGASRSIRYPPFSLSSQRGFCRKATPRASEHKGASARDAEKLLTADELAEYLGMHESWVRTEERAGRIPGVRLGKYVRFKLSDVERALAERQRQ